MTPKKSDKDEILKDEILKAEEKEDIRTLENVSHIKATDEDLKEIKAFSNEPTNAPNNEIKESRELKDSKNPFTKEHNPSATEIMNPISAAIGAEPDLKTKSEIKAENKSGIRFEDKDNIKNEIGDNIKVDESVKTTFHKAGETEKENAAKVADAGIDLEARHKLRDDNVAGESIRDVEKSIAAGQKMPRDYGDYHTHDRDNSAKLNQIEAILKQTAIDSQQLKKAMPKIEEVLKS